jgi:hypothetical protein
MRGLLCIRWASTEELVVAEISRAGEAGYTCAICEFGADTWDGETVASSSFLRIWKNQLAGQWEFILDRASPIAQSPAESILSMGICCDINLSLMSSALFMCYTYEDLKQSHQECRKSRALVSSF